MTARPFSLQAVKNQINMRRGIGVAVILALFCSAAFSQTRNVEGTVQDAADSTGLPGVNVVVQGTSRGTSTDLNGHYSLDLNEGDNTLVFTFIGYETQTVTVGNRTTINIALAQEVKALQEVVVVGYGEQKKSDITGSTANVDGKILAEQPVLTATQAMQGKLAGVQIISSGQPGSSPQVRIRGVSTALAGTSPLYVVDGVLTDDISNINTADIVDVNVLKDASASAIYGSRGANGVIIITTKKGKAGDMHISYNNSIGIQQATNLVKMANAAEYDNYVQAASGSPPPASDYNTDWYGVILRNAWQQNHNISLSGGTDKSTYLLNTSYLDDQGIVIDNDFKRWTIRLNTEYNIRKNLKFGVLSSFGNSINENGFNNLDIDAYGNIGSVYNDAYRASPIVPSIIDGKYGNTSAYQNVGNPLLDIKDNKIRVNDNRLQGSSYLKFEPVTWLSLKSSFGVDWDYSSNRGYYYKFLADDQTFLNAGGNQQRTRSNLAVSQTQWMHWVWDNTATITRQFGKNNLVFLVGTTAEKYTNQYLYGTRDDVPADPNLWYIGVGDANTSKNNGTGDAWARNSYLARLNYNFDEKYLLTANFRADGSSLLPSQNRWREYPSLGLAWILTNESFMQAQHLFDMLKLRASYGKVGNDKIPTGSYSQVVTLNQAYAFNGSSSAATNGAKIEQIVDPNITWETTVETDGAVEFGLLRNRLTGEVDYYNKKVQNALINVPIQRTVGDIDGLVLTNVASIQNRGLEANLNWRNTINDNWSYHVGANATLNKNKVVALNGGQAIYGGSIGAAQGFTTYTDNGLPVGSFYVLQVIGVFNSDEEVSDYKASDGTVIQPSAKPGDFKYQDTNGDGKIDDSDRIFAGSYQPKAYFGLNGGVNYKAWDLSLSLYGNEGNEVYNGKKAVRIDARDNVESDVVYNRWTSQNHTQTEPRANSGNLPASTYFVESGSFVRINNVTVGYTLPKDKLEKVGIQSLRIFATSQNLLTLKKFSGFTPELPGTPLDSGIELSAYPTTRTIAMGVNITL